MKNILFITNYKPNAGGISIQVDLLAKYLEEENYNTEIFTTKGSVFGRIFLFFSLLKKGKNFDVFHIHTCSYAGFYSAVLGIIVGKLLHKKIIITYHGGGADEFFSKYPKFVRFFLIKSDVNVVLSGFLAKIFQKNNIPYIIIPNIISFPDSAFKERQKINPNFISVRSLFSLYNIECIIKAFEVVSDKLPKAKLTILGDGSSRQKLEEYVSENKIKNIEFVGKVDNKDVLNYLAKSDVFLSSPIVDNQPVSILEAFKAGLLVISSNVGGVPYIVEDNFSGILFESNNYKELSDKMLLAIENQEASLKMIKNASEEIKKYSWANIRHEIINLYK